MWLWDTLALWRACEQCVCPGSAQSEGVDPLEFCSLGPACAVVMSQHLLCRAASMSHCTGC